MGEERGKKKLEEACMEMMKMERNFEQIECSCKDFLDIQGGLEKDELDKLNNLLKIKLFV